MKKTVLVPALLSLALGGCVSSAQKDKYSDSSIYKTHPDYIRITDDDLQQRPYEVLGEVSATVPQPSDTEAGLTAQLSEQMKEQAAMLGADAIIFVRLAVADTAGLPQDELAGHGRAIRFIE